MIRSAKSSQPDVTIISVEGGGSRNSLMGVESCGRDSCSMDSGGKGRWKEK